MLLDNQATFKARAVSVNGGNIRLRDLDLLLMRRNSQISATDAIAGTARNGGNLDINTDLLVAAASENSNIIANGFEGNGGRVNITAEGILGIQAHDILLSLGNTACAQQDTQAALKFYQQAANASPTIRVQSQLNQLSLLVETKQWNSAKALYPQIQPQLSNLPPSRTVVNAKINFAQSIVQLKNSHTTNSLS